MSGSIGNHAIVVGAGMAGLAAAAALSSHFLRVTVLERDVLPSDAAARAGIPQGRHIHALLAGGLVALEKLLPGLEADLEQAGAVRLTNTSARMERPGFDSFPQREFGVSWLSASRPLLEFVTRRAVGRHGNIEWRDQCRVIEPTFDAGRVAVTGVRCAGQDHGVGTISADLVVDASGRGTLTWAALEAMGFAKPEETAIGVDFAYSTAIFELPADDCPPWRTVIVLPSAPATSRGAALAAIENGRWMVSIGANHGDVPPGDLEGFIAFARTLRTTTVHDAIRGARPVGEIFRYQLPCSTRRHFEKLPRFPRGLLVVGDAICRFNPVYGQGMSVGAQEAVILASLLRARAAETDPLDGLAPAFFAEVQAVLETPWGIANNDFIYPNTRGARPADFERRLKFNRALVYLAAHDASVHKLMFEVNQLLKPQSALRTPGIIERVTRVMALPHDVSSHCSAFGDAEWIRAD